MAQENGNWIMIVGDADGEQRLYRIRQEIPDAISKAEFAECVIIEWRFGDEGWPDTRLTALHKTFEALLEPLCDNVTNSLLMHVYTGGGIKEWCYYAKNYDRFIRELNDSLVGKPRFPIEIMHDNDPAWKYWAGIKQFATVGAKT